MNRPKTIHEAPNKIKEKVLPPDGYRFVLNGKFVYEVCHRNVGKARFSAKFVGMKVIEESLRKQK